MINIAYGDLLILAYKSINKNNEHKFWAVCEQNGLRVLYKHFKSFLLLVSYNNHHSFADDVKRSEKVI